MHTLVRAKHKKLENAFFGNIGYFFQEFFNIRVVQMAVSLWRPCLYWDKTTSKILTMERGGWEEGLVSHLNTLVLIDVLINHPTASIF